MKELISKAIGHEGICLGSKGRYCFNNPTHIVVFNANIVIGKKKVWWGDLDITKSFKKLAKISVDSGKTIVILGEQDGRDEDKMDLSDPIMKIKDGKIVKNEYTMKRGVPVIEEDEGDTEIPKWEKPTDFYKEEDFEAIPVPFDAFKGQVNKYDKHGNKKQKGIAPHHMISTYLVETFGLQKAKHIADYGLMTVHDYDVIEKAVEALMKKEGYDEYEIQKSIGWLCFAMPKRFYEGNPPWVKPNHLYLQLVDKEGKKIEMKELTQEFIDEYSKNNSKEDDDDY